MEQIGGTAYSQASYQKVHETAMGILQALGSEELGYSMLGSAAVIARLSNPDRKLDHSEEINFIQQLMEWNDAYWSVDSRAVMN